MTVERRTICPACQYPLDGLPGVPAGVAAAFKDDVACPECGGVIASGTRLLVGGASPFAMIRGRAWYARLILELAFGRGCLTAILHLVAAWGAWYLSSASIDLLSGGQRYAGGFRGFGLVVAVASVLGVVLFWWRRRRPSMHHGVRASECDRWLAVAPTGVRDGFRVLSPSEVRTIEVFECFGAGDGNTIVCVQAMARTKNGFFQLSRPVHAAVPAGSARRLASELMASLRGRSAPAEALGDELRGESTLPHPMLRGLRSTALAGVPIAILLAVLLHAGLGGFFFMFVVLPLFLFSTLASGDCVSAWRPGPDGLEIADQGIVLRALSADGNIPTGPEVRHFCAYAALTRLELNEHRGMLFLVLHTRTSIDFRQPTGRFRARLVPDDFLGMEPESFARKVAERLRVPLRLQRTVRR